MFTSTTLVAAVYCTHNALRRNSVMQLHRCGCSKYYRLLLAYLVYTEMHVQYKPEAACGAVNCGVQHFS